MSAKRTAAYLGGASLVAAWLASAAGVGPREPLPQEEAQPVQTAGTETLASDVQAQTERLRHRLAAAPAPQEPLRNPFAFAPRLPAAERRPARTADPDPVEIPPLPPAEHPLLSLIGIAENGTGDELVRTAMLATATGELLTVTRGQPVIGLYRVEAVHADSVELSELAGGAVRRLALRD
ncbi:MAG TPA: hypothetical protein VD833_20170 [Vicinamibacterales bacterium]|nr:hypothetical protein [Vicinamibacterales bacterium]